MRNLIRRWFRHERQISVPEPLPAPAPAPKPVPEPRTSDGPSCRVYVWATAHGIDLRPQSLLSTCTCADRAHQPRPAIGSFVLDKRDGAVGQVMRNGGSQLLLRLPGGGKEWAVDPFEVRTPTEAELLSAKVQAANAASRWGR
ncbi:hypothetical protein ACFY97_08205 [Streptomyces klenkii]|uniref:hypothetical protein n=1 Tax=Streptomyces klenkii TaxID=1420899 RepID=UPI0036E7A832